MKTYLEVAQDVFRKGDDYLQQKEQKRNSIKKGAAAGFLAVLGIAAFGLLKQLSDVKNPTLMPGTTESVHITENIQANSDNEELPAAIDTSDADSSQITTTPHQTSNEPTSGTKNIERDTTVPPESDQERTTKTIPHQTSNEPTTGTRIIERDTTVPSESDPERTTKKEDEPPTSKPSTDSAPTTPSGAPSYSGSARLRTALEENACGWIRYNGAYYLQDDWSNGNAVENCERIGSTSTVEGNPELLGLTGDVFLVTDDNYSGCLLLRTDAGRNIVFVRVPDVK